MSIWKLSDIQATQLTKTHQNACHVHVFPPYKNVGFIYLFVYLYFIRVLCATQSIQRLDNVENRKETIGGKGLA